jgi:preprotein translocase subunit YajC
MGWLSVAFLFAVGDEKGPAPGAGQNPDFFSTMLPPLVAIAFVFYFFVIRPQRREQTSRESMLAALKKNDRVVTVGGIIASVANITSDGQEVTLKVDDNTRIKFLRSSIQRVLSSEGEGEKPAESK